MATHRAAVLSLFVVIGSPGCQNQRAGCNAVLIECVTEIPPRNNGAAGLRKPWHAFKREGVSLGREHTARFSVSSGTQLKATGR
ncbi:hypothetical protein CAURIC_00365 [Corynebacterium auriscanis]|nr:hypothetical protein CAURIC_00365 [Corynebacterium auriscanis]